MRHWLAAGVAVMVTAVVSLPALSSGGGEFVCEEAVAHLRDCCTGYDPTAVNCSYRTDCTGHSPNVGPDISEAASKCVKSLDCPTIVERDLCEVPTSEDWRCP